MKNEFMFQTNYDITALTAMSKALRKTARRKRSRRSHVFGWIVIILVVLLSLAQSDTYIVDFKRIVTWLAALAILISFLFEDRLNGLITKKRMLPGLISSTATFTQESYCSVTEVGTSEFSYSNITDIAETERYFIFVFGNNHAQVYDKQGLKSGTIDEFAAFISSVTEKTIKRI